MTADAPQSRISLIHPEIRTLTAYHVAPAKGMIKLDAMESPYGIDGALRERWTRRIKDLEVNRYPDPHAVDLKQQLRRVFEIPENFDLMLGNGSDELLQLIQMAVGGAGSCIMSPVPSFAMYEIIAQYTRSRFVGVSLDGDFQLPREEWLSAIHREKPKCVFFSHPNNPTGNFFPQSLIEETASSVDGLVVVDEAYFAYSGRSMLSDLERFDNMVVVRTLSKSGLAGLRIGYLIGAPAWISEFEKLRLPYNIDVLSLESAVFALENWTTISLGTHRNQPRTNQR